MTEHLHPGDSGRLREDLAIRRAATVIDDHDRGELFLRQAADELDQGLGRAARRDRDRDIARAGHLLPGSAGTAGCSGMAAPSVRGSDAPKFTPRLASRMTASPFPITLEYGPIGVRT